MVVKSYDKLLRNKVGVMVRTETTNIAHSRDYKTKKFDKKIPRMMTTKKRGEKKKNKGKDG